MQENVIYDIKCYLLSAVENVKTTINLLETVRNKDCFIFNIVYCT